MNRIVEPRSPSPPLSGPPGTMGARNISIPPSAVVVSEQSHPDMMDVTPPTSAAIAMNNSTDSPEIIDQGNIANTNGAVEIGRENNVYSSNLTLGAAAAAAAQQPKVVQTAFIHKLYNMLEDQSIQHLISWSSSNESFVMSPSGEFSKVLAQYFKHTNISSFVRQLNMYGFHKVSDVFHTGSPDSALWEFKHGNGNFKRGDLVGLREIKRRASRHALIHRDSFSSQRQAPLPTQGLPSEPASDNNDMRLLHLEHTVYDMHARLSRAEENYSSVSSKCNALTEGIIRCHQWNYSLSHFVMSLCPSPDSPLYRDVTGMQKEIAKQIEQVKALENSHETLLSGKQPFFGNMTLDAPPLSPRQMAVDEPHRPNVLEAPRSGIIRPPVPPHLSISPRRFGSISGANPSPGYNRSPIPTSQVHPPPPPPHPLSSVTSPPGPNLARRHTSADIRVHGWPGHTSSPFASGTSTHWPSSPSRTPIQEGQHVRDVLAQYEMGGPRRSNGSRQASPPPSSDPSSNLTVDSGWMLGGSRYSRTTEHSAPATRRSSMASNVHSLLNPAETVEREDEDDPMEGEDRKRKRLQ